MKRARLSLLLCCILTGTASAASEPGSTGARVIPDLFSSKTHATQPESKPFANAPAPATKAAELPVAKAADAQQTKPAAANVVKQAQAPAAKPVSSEKTVKVAKKPAHRDATAKPAVSDKSQTVIDTVKAWAAAWSAKDTDKYLAFYATDFLPPKGLSRTDWEAQRRERIAKPAHIRVNAKKIKVDFADESHVTVKFHQNYHASNIKSADNKILLMVKSGDTWLIQEERKN
jgi:ketosteroid isomerase-like protein